MLLVNVGGPGAPGTIRSLRSQKERIINLIGIDTNEYCAARPLLDSFYLAPRTADAVFMPFVRDLCAREHIDVILPLSSLGIEAFKSLSEEVDTPKVVVGSETSLAKALNKGTLFSFLKEAGCEEYLPEYRSASNKDDFLAAVEEFKFPERAVCFKPEEGKGSRGFRILADRSPSFSDILNEKAVGGTVDIHTLFSNTDTDFPPVLVMEYLPGKEYSVDVLAERGETRVAIPRSRDAVQAGIASAGVVEKVPELIDASRAIVRALDGNGLLNIQFKYDTQGVPKLLEVNPRISGTIAHCTCAGVNLPYLAVKQALGEPLTIPEPVWGTRLARGFFEAYEQEGDWHLL